MASQLGSCRNQTPESCNRVNPRRQPCRQSIMDKLNWWAGVKSSNIWSAFPEVCIKHKTSQVWKDSYDTASRLVRTRVKQRKLWMPSTRHVNASCPCCGSPGFGHTLWSPVETTQQREPYTADLIGRLALADVDRNIRSHQAGHRVSAYSFLLSSNGYLFHKTINCISQAFRQMTQVDFF